MEDSTFNAAVRDYLIKEKLVGFGAIVFETEIIPFHSPLAVDGKNFRIRTSAGEFVVSTEEVLFHAKNYENQKA